MASRSLQVFLSHIAECNEAIAIYDHLEKNAGFRADFNLRFVWIAAVSALDHYISQLILERATHAFGNGLPLEGKLMSDVMSFSSAIALRQADPVMAVVVFRQILDQSIRYRSFHSPDNISDGLSYVWRHKHKWQEIASSLSQPVESTKRKLSAIVDRRNLIAHNGDYDESRNSKLPVNKLDAQEVINFIHSLVQVIDHKVP